MRKEITLGQLLGAAMTLLVAMASGWLSLVNKVSKQEQKIQQMESSWFSAQMKIDQVLDRLEQKQDRTADDIRQILIEMQNKQNRK